jgi:putative redox protein
MKNAMRSRIHDLFIRKIKFTGDITAEQQESMLKIADKCPVHRTLEGEIHIETLVVE